MSERDLFFACSGMCESLHRFLICEREYENYKLYSVDDERMKIALDFERKRVEGSFKRLKKVVDEVCGEYVK